MRGLDAVLRAITPWGWTLVAVAFVGVVLARTLGWTEALVAAVGALVLVLAAIPWIVGERWARARIGLSATLEFDRPIRVNTDGEVLEATRCEYRVRHRAATFVCGEPRFALASRQDGLKA